MTVKPSDTNLLPNLPGVYKYFNKAGVLTYVGKAKDLKKKSKKLFHQQEKS